MKDTTRTEHALDVLLRAVIEHDAKRPPTRPLTATPFVMPDRAMTRAEVGVAALLADPIGAALRQSVWRLGLHLFDAIGSTDGMHEVLDRIADLDPARSGERASIMNHAWDGVGSETDRWRS